MNIDFKSMEGRKKKLYSALWGDFDFSTINAKIENTRNLKDSKPSRNSYCFSGEMDKHGELLMKIFGITDKEKELFKEKFAMAVSGSGQELLKIGTLHSSSLCALLHFYNVDDNPLILDGLETNKTTRTIKFTRSLFEYKSPVINTNHPSNMDVVLIGKDMESGEDIVLFLESKFAEYYTSASTKCKGISQKYLDNKYGSDLYKDNVLTRLGLKRNNYDTKHFELVSMSEPFYIGGIKQMISHYIGIRNVLNKKYCEGKKQDNASKQKEVEKAIETGNGGKGAIVILGEIVFDRFIGDLELKPGLKCGAIYSQKYEILADEIGKLIKNEKVERFEILKKELGYSLFLTNPHKIEDRISQFYREK
jgi:hypothetical protein